MIKIIKQVIIERKRTQVDEGTMGFHDYETVKEDIETFCFRVEEYANRVTGKVINIAYPNEDLAIIVYKEKRE